jgi:hypothetical protein
MRIALTVFIGLSLYFIVSSCARQSSPMGGPKDEDPPLLLSSSPENEAINTNPAAIELLFNEYIKIENPTKQIIITPKINSDEVEFLAAKNRLSIKLNQDLEDSTTYVFNFQKSVQDITESNPVNNLKLVFSTGSAIDSLKFSGTLSYVFPRGEKDIVDVLVGLYPAADTTDIFSAAPYYIAQSDSLGNFEITNIKSGEYRAYAWHDDNNSLKAEFRSEAYGFLNENIQLDSNVSNVYFKLYSGDLSELKINRSSAVGSNYDLILSKFPAEFKVLHPEINKKIFYRLDEKNIRLYHIGETKDSTAVRLTVKDSVGFSIDTTFFAKFEESDRSPQNLEVTVNSGKGFLRQLQSQLNFNKPIHAINYDSLFIRYDSASRIPILPDNVNLLDSSDFTKLQITIDIPDSLSFETFTVFAADSTFMDVESQWNQSKVEANYNKLKEESLADEVSGKVETDELPIIVQLIDKSDNVVREAYLTTANTFKFTDFEAGDYKLRAIIDRNKNKRWDPGNLLEKRQPEPVYHFYDIENDTDQFIIRGAWTLENFIIHKTDDSGIVRPVE